MIWNWKGYIIFVIAGVIITLSWIGLEFILDGTITPLHSDSVVALILAYFVTDKICNRLYK
jgi:hypothetical protein